MADVQAAYGIEILVEGNDKAIDAAKSLETLREKVQEDTAALREMQASLKRLQLGTSVSIDQFRKLRAGIAAKKLEIAQATQKIVGMKGAFEGLGPAAKKAKSATEEVAFRTLKTEVLGAERSVLGLRLSTLKAVPAKYALAAGIVAVTVALAAAYAAVVKFGAAAADARRSEAIMLQAAGTHLWYAYGVEVSKAADLTEQGAKAIQGAIDRVALSSATSRDKISGFAEQLLEARVQGRDLEVALKAISTAAAVGKESGLVGQFAALKYAGFSVDALAAKIDQKFGGLARRRMLSLDVQFAKFHENLAALFKSVNIEPLLGALDKVLSLFSQATVTGYSLRAIIGALFPTDSAKTFGDIAAQVFKRLVNWGLRATLAFLQIKNTVSEIIPPATLLKGAAVLAGAAVIALVGTLAIAAAKLAALFAILSIGFDGIRAVWAYLSGDAKLGDQLVEGIIAGIKRGAIKLWTAIKDLAKGAINIFRSENEIHSPSKLWEKSAIELPRGAARGIDRGAGEVAGAARDMAPAPEAIMAAPSGTKKGGGGRPVVVNVSVDMKINGSDGKKIAQDFESELAGAVERAAQRLGLVLETA